MQIPFFSKWIESRREKQMWKEIHAHEDKENQQRLEVYKTEHPAKFGHELVNDFGDEWCRICHLEDLDRQSLAKTYQEHRDNFGHDFDPGYLSIDPYVIHSASCVTCERVSDEPYEDDEDNKDPLAGEVDPVGGWDETEYNIWDSSTDPWTLVGTTKTE